MTRFTLIGAAVLLALVLLVPAFALSTAPSSYNPYNHGAVLDRQLPPAPAQAPVRHTGSRVFLLLASLTALAGVTVTYAYPVTGTVAPTVAQARHCNALTAKVVFADGDTTATITHNWQESTTALAELSPWCRVYNDTLGTALPYLSFVLTDSVSVALLKAAGNGTGGTFVVILERPHSIVR